MSQYIIIINNLKIYVINLSIVYKNNKINFSNEKRKWKRKYTKVLSEFIQTCKDKGRIQKRVQKVRRKAGE